MRQSMKRLDLPAALCLALLSLVVLFPGEAFAHGVEAGFLEGEHQIVTSLSLAHAVVEYILSVQSPTRAVAVLADVRIQSLA